MYSPDTLKRLNEKEYQKWVERSKKNEVVEQAKIEKQLSTTLGIPQSTPVPQSPEQAHQQNKSRKTKEMDHGELAGDTNPIMPPKEM
jgi:hypothetical protein